MITVRQNKAVIFVFPQKGSKKRSSSTQKADLGPVEQGGSQHVYRRPIVRLIFLFLQKRGKIIILFVCRRIGLVCSKPWRSEPRGPGLGVLPAIGQEFNSCVSVLCSDGGGGGGGGGRVRCVVLFRVGRSLKISVI